jgi:hypothetical protein
MDLDHIDAFGGEDGIEVGGELDVSVADQELALDTMAHTVAVGTAHRAMALLKTELLIEVARGHRAIVAEISQLARLKARELHDRSAAASA